MAATVKEPESKTIVRFQDCDPFGHLNNSRYFDYLLNAREDQLVQAYGFDIYARAKESRCNWVVARHQIAYLAPVVYCETVLIRTSLRRYTDQSALVESRMYNETGVRLKALLWTDYVYVSVDTGRPTKHAPDIMAFLGEVHLEEQGFPRDFGDRVGMLSGRPPA